MAVPHTRPTGVTAHATRRELITGHEPWLQRVQVPGSAGHLLEYRLGEQGRDALGFAVHVPHYLAQSEYPAAAELLLASVSRRHRPAAAHASELRAAAEVVRVEIDQQVAQTEEAGAAGAGAGGAVRRVRPRPRRAATCWPTQTGPLPTADELGAELERFLAEQSPPRATPRSADAARGGAAMRQAGGMRLATWNVNSVKARLPRLLDWLADHRSPTWSACRRPSARTGRSRSPRSASWATTVASHSDGRWNGVAILSRVGLTTSRSGFPGEPGFPEPEARAISATCDGLRVWSVYVPNGRDARRPALRVQAGLVRRAARRARSRAGGRAAAGGLRRLQRRPDRRRRLGPGALRRLHPRHPGRSGPRSPRCATSGLVDVVPTPMKGPHPFTYWDYRAGMFHQNKGMRIDLVYATAAVRRRRPVRVRRPGGPQGQGPSDHAPIVVDADLGPAVEAF